MWRTGVGSTAQPRQEAFAAPHDSQAGGKSHELEQTEVDKWLHLHLRTVSAGLCPTATDCTHSNIRRTRSSPVYADGREIQQRRIGGVVRGLKLLKIALVRL